MKSTLIDQPKSRELSEDDVIAFLRQNPDFLADRPALIAELELPHHQGGTVSLVERQVAILRDRNITMRHRLSDLLQTARRNDELFEKTRGLVIDLIKSQSRHTLVSALFDALTQRFDIRHFRLVLVSESGQSLNKDKHLRCMNQEQADQPPLKSLLHQRNAFCGQLSRTEYDALFGTEAATIGSVAIAPLRQLQGNFISGALILANKDPDYYHSTTDTLFLGFIVDLFTTLFNSHSQY